MRLLALVASAVISTASLLACDASRNAPLRNDHLVTDLPGLAKPKTLGFDHFAGQLELATSEKIFYWYAESKQDPATDPIVLWLNGGPGCSSINGMFTENGPFVVGPDGKLLRNAYAWNRKVNLVWVESPAGVGFSEPQQPAEYYNDDVVADRLHQFLAAFFAKYSELQGRELYITGESYAGIYIPYLVELLVERPIAGVNLAGFAIGNPLTDNEIDGNAYMEYYYTHALISLQNYRKMLEYCSDEIAQCMFTPVNCSARCQEAVDEGIAASDAGHFNPYFIYGDVCLLSNGQGGALHFTKRKHHPTPVTHRGDVGPCTDTFTLEYLNTPELQAAVHLENPITWQDCNPYISEHFTRSLSSLPKYRSILSRDLGLKVLIYSGDADSVVNFIGTERWIAWEQGLNLSETTPWKAWYGPDRQIGGYVQGYKGLTFKTVKGAGHMVPAVRPLHGLNMFECFIYGEQACAEFEYPKDAFEVETGQIADLDDNADDEKVEDDALRRVRLQKATMNAHRQQIETHQSSLPSTAVLVVAAAAVGVCALVAHRLVRGAAWRHRRHAFTNAERTPLSSSA
ncbi:hypothetical protein PINS_up001072 [Pythium insidiosum]|nr:hypothetical protein PINS_up001072 [Pythium insidiosum]